MSIVECAPEGPWFEEVLHLSKLAKATVGFLPDSAFRERASRGTLLLAVEGDDRVAAYVMYDLPRNEVRLRQLVTGTDCVGRGYARRLVDELQARHGARIGIYLECRRDFEVSAMWPKLGFVPLNERPGRSHAGLPLTIWYRSFGHPTLFTPVTEPDARPIAALDNNIVVDLADESPAVSDKLRAEWIRNAVQFGITGHVLVEVDRQDDPELRAERRGFASSLQILECPSDRWQSLYELLRDAHQESDRYEDDFLHAAKAAAGGARWLITRDGRFKRAHRDTIARICQLDVVSPGEFLVAVDAMLRDDAYRPTDLAASDLQVRDLQPREYEAAARQFLNQAEGEELGRLRRKLEAIARDVPATRIRTIIDGENVVGLLATRMGQTYDLEVCRVSALDTRRQTIARQLVAIARDEAAGAGAALVRLLDAHAGTEIRVSVRQEGFLPSGPEFVAMPIAGFGPRTKLRSQVDRNLAGLQRHSLPPDFELTARDERAEGAAERLFHPWRLTDSRLPTFVVPIEPAWAVELFDSELSRSSLFPRSTGLTLQREHVYYRSPVATGGLTAPGRIVWYVLAKRHQPGSLRAVSTLGEIAIGSPSRLHQRFRHLGVYGRKDVERVSRDDRVMALHFTNTMLFPKPMPLPEYRALMARYDTGLLLQGPQRVTEHVFADVLASVHG